MNPIAVEILTGPWAVVCGSALGVFVGAFLGHRLALTKDRRKERNDVAHRIHTTLLRRGGLDPIDTDLYLQMISFRQRWRFSRAVERHQKATADCQYDPNYGTVVFPAGADAERQASIEALLRLTRWQ